MPDQTAKRTEDAIARAVKIARRIARGNDLRVREKIEAFQTKLRYRKQELCIAKEAWRHVAEAPAGCKNFLIAGVVTATMRERLREMQIEADFDIDNSSATRVRGKIS